MGFALAQTARAALNFVGIDEIKIFNTNITWANTENEI